MNIVVARPPIWDRLVVLLPNEQQRRRVIFSWGDTIYNPDDVKISPSLLEHERVHGAQHRRHGGPEPWWDRYLADPAFRLDQELAAHKREFWAYCDQVPDKRLRDFMRQSIARRLSGPLYGRAISFNQALKAIG